jgi:hypothetical protein
VRGEGPRRTRRKPDYAQIGEWGAVHCASLAGKAYHGRMRSVPSAYLNASNQSALAEARLREEPDDEDEDEEEDKDDDAGDQDDDDSGSDGYSE